MVGEKLSSDVSQSLTGWRQEPAAAGKRGNEEHKDQDLEEHEFAEDRHGMQEN